MGVAPDEKNFQKPDMPFEFIQIPANGQGSAKEEQQHKLLRGEGISSVRKEFVGNGDASCWAFWNQSQRDSHQSQRDYVPKPRVARNSLPWDTARAESSTPQGMRVKVRAEFPESGPTDSSRSGGTCPPMPMRSQ